MKPDIWINGSFTAWDEATIHPLAHSMQRGATLFESIDCIESVDGRPAIFRLADHLIRFENSASIVGMTIGYTRQELARAVIDTVARSGMTACTIRPLAFYSDPVFDIYPGDAQVTVVIGLGEKKPLKDAIKVRISPFRKIDCTSMPVHAKVSGNYIAPMIAKSAAIREGFDDTVLLDHDGYVAEGATANVFIVEKGRIITSPGDRILQGITRNTIMALTVELGIELLEERYLPERLVGADEVFNSSSGLGVMPVTNIDGTVIGDGVPGPVTGRLRSFYQDVVTGAVPAFTHWLDIIG